MRADENSLPALGGSRFSNVAWLMECAFGPLRQAYKDHLIQQDAALSLTRPVILDEDASCASSGSAAITEHAKGNTTEDVISSTPQRGQNVVTAESAAYNAPHSIKAASAACSGRLPTVLAAAGGVLTSKRAILRDLEELISGGGSSMW